MPESKNNDGFPRAMCLLSEEASQSSLSYQCLLLTALTTYYYLLMFLLIKYSSSLFYSVFVLLLFEILQSHSVAKYRPYRTSRLNAPVWSEQRFQNQADIRRLPPLPEIAFFDHGPGNAMKITGIRCRMSQRFLLQSAAATG